MKYSKVENDIEKCRMTGNWSKASDLATVMTKKAGYNEPYTTLILVEARFERCLDESTGTTVSNLNILSEVHTQFTDLLSKDLDSARKFDVQLMIIKCKYMLERHEESLSLIAAINSDKINLDEMSIRSMQLLAQSFAIKGLSLEKTYSSINIDKDVLQAFEQSGDIALKVLQKVEESMKASNWTGTVDTSGGSLPSCPSLGALVETAIQRCPIMHIRSGNLQKAISRFRDFLRAPEMQSVFGLRHTLARQLAEVLLRGVCANSYVPLTTNLQAKNTDTFVPKTCDEEAILLLLIAESMVSREAVLNRSPEHKEARLHTFYSTTVVYNLLTFILVRKAQFDMLSQTFERSMKFSFDEFHIWYQFALSLICAEKYKRAHLVLCECIRLAEGNPLPNIQAAQLCFQHLAMVDEGIVHAQKAVEMSNGQPLASRALVTLGIGYSLQSESTRSQSQRTELQKLSLQSFIQASKLDPNDHLVQFNLGLQYALQRQIHEAMMHTKQALKIFGDHIHSLHLLALLLSAQKKESEALMLLDAALHEHPLSFSLLMCKMKLEERTGNLSRALGCCKNMLHLWKQLYNTIDGESRGTGLIDKMTADVSAYISVPLSEISDQDSVKAESLAASRVEYALSQVASSMTSGSQANSQPKKGPHQAWNLQATIWLSLAEIYLNAERVNEAKACWTEASHIHPVSHMLSYVRGRILEFKEVYDEAKCCYENAIAINPSHVPSLQRLGYVLLKLGCARLAEKTLRDAVYIDPTACESWDSLGQALAVMEEYDRASDCFDTALRLEATNPVLPFTVVHKAFQ